MSNRPDFPREDPRVLGAKDEIYWGARALRAVADLVMEAGRAEGGFELVGPLDLGELLDMVTCRIEAPAHMLVAPPKGE